MSNNLCPIFRILQPIRWYLFIHEKITLNKLYFNHFSKNFNIMLATELSNAHLITIVLVKCSQFLETDIFNKFQKKSECTSGPSVPNKEFTTVDTDLDEASLMDSRFIYGFKVGTGLRQKGLIKLTDCKYCSRISL